MALTAIIQWCGSTLTSVIRPTVQPTPLPHLPILTRSAHKLCRKTFSLIIAFVIILYSFRYSGTYLKADLCVQILKFVSLLALSIQTQRMVEGTTVTRRGQPRADGAGERLANLLGNSYKAIRIYIIVCLVILAFALAVETVLAINPQRAIDLSKIDELIPESVEYIFIYVLNGALLAPIILYTIANYFRARQRAIPGTVRRHLQNFLFFVDFPLCFSIVALVLVVYVISRGGWTQPQDAALFFGGAAALLVFLTSSTTICVDEHARFVIYRRRMTYVPSRWYLHCILGLGLCSLGVALIVVASPRPYDMGVFPNAISWAMILAGLFQFSHAISLEIGWPEFLVSASMASLYAVAGILISEEPGGLLYVLASFPLIVHSILKCILARRDGSNFGILLLISAVASGIAVLYICGQYIGFWSKLAPLFLIFSVDLTAHGLWWLRLGCTWKRTAALTATPLP
jgi:hypothetical protein